MKKPFKLNTATYYLPTDWSEVTYDQYVQITDLPDNLNGTEKATRIVAVVTGVPLETLEAAGIGLVVPLFDELAFMQVPPKAAVIEHVSIAGVNYYAQHITTVGELAAFDRVHNAESLSEGQKLPYVLAILLRRMESVASVKPTLLQKLLGRKPDTDSARVEYEAFRNDESWVTSRAKLFGSMLSPSQVLGLASFFLLSVKNSPTTTLRSSHLAATVQKLRKLSAAISALSTVGQRRSTTWNRMFSSTLRCYIWTLGRSLTSSSTSGK